MTEPSFKLLPCVFCTLGYNAYVAGFKAISKTTQRLTKNKTTVPQVQPFRAINIEPDLKSK